MSKKVAVLIKDRNRQYEGLRVSLGLLLEQHIVSMFVLDNEIDVSSEYTENLEFIDEMDGARFSNMETNVVKYNFKPVTLDEVNTKIKSCDLIIPF